MSKSTALRSIKQERRVAVMAFLIAMSPEDVRASRKVRRVLRRRRLAQIAKP